MVITPLAWPVSTGAVPGSPGSARKAKAKPCAGSSALATRGSPRWPEAVEEAAFGDFEPVPGGVMAGLAQVGEHLGEAAGPAEGLRVARRHRPVTEMGLRIVLGGA